MARASGILVSSVLAFGLGLGLALVGGPRLDPEPRSGSEIPAGDTSVVSRAELVSQDNLPDAAIAVYDSAHPRIYLNRRILNQVGPSLVAFLMTHEQGHLAYHHSRERGFGFGTSPTPASTLHRYEFVADCYAVQALHRSRPDAVVAAVQFFQKRRGQPTDADHPPMGERADSLLACLGSLTP
ncbi:MAG TPA: hypothetical protein VH763_07895 [Gemmatimonadales bacterium]|jgi:Zn-dependent protease with chaperone function